MQATSDTPRVWIGCLAAYNGGELHGEWVNATDVDELQEAAARVIKTSPGDFPEEIFLADNEGFGGLIGEYENLERVAELGTAIEEHGPAFLAYVGLGIHGSDAEVSELVDGFEEAYQGEHDSETDFAYSIVDDLGMLSEVPDSIAMYFDFEKYGRDLFLDGYTFTNGYVFRDY